MSVPVNDNFAISAPKPIDERQAGSFSGGRSIPYASVSAANIKVVKPVRYKTLTVPVLVGGLSVMHWWKDGVEDSDLVPRDQWGGLSGDITDQTDLIVYIASQIADNVVNIAEIYYSDLESDHKTYVNTDLADKTFKLFQNGINRFLYQSEYDIIPSGGFELANELSDGDAIFLMGQIGGVLDDLGSVYAIVDSYDDIIINPLWGGDTEVNFYVTVDNKNMGGKKGAYKYVPDFTPTPAQMAINFND